MPNIWWHLDDSIAGSGIMVVEQHRLVISKGIKLLIEELGAKTA